MKDINNIGIIAEDGALASAIYQAVIDLINQHGSQGKRLSHPNVCLLRRTKKSNRAERAILQDTELLRKLETDLVFYPEAHMQPFVSSAESKIPVRALPREDLIEGHESESERKQKILHIAKHVFESIYHEHSATDTKRQSRRLKLPIYSQKYSEEKVPLIAIHGGMGPESGNDAFSQLCDMYDGDALLYSAARTPNAAKTFLKEISTDGYSFTKNPLPQLAEDRKRLLSIKPDAVVMACNTMHLFQPALVGDRVNKQKIPTFHIVEKGIQSIPSHARVLVLATSASLENALIQQVTNQLGREDVTYLYPTKQDQEKIDQAIEDYVLRGNDYVAAGKLIKSVVQQYAKQLGRKGVVMGGCTEIAVALRKGSIELWDHEEIRHQEVKDRLLRLIGLKPDLIVLNLSDNPAPVFSDYAPKPKAMLLFCDNLRIALENAVEMVEKSSKTPSEPQKRAR